MRGVFSSIARWRSESGVFCFLLLVRSKFCRPPANGSILTPKGRMCCGRKAGILFTFHLRPFCFVRRSLIRVPNGRDRQSNARWRVFEGGCCDPAAVRWKPIERAAFQMSAQYPSERSSFLAPIRTQLAAGRAVSWLFGRRLISALAERLTSNGNSLRLPTRHFSN